MWSGATRRGQRAHASGPPGQPSIVLAVGPCATYLLLSTNCGEIRAAAQL